MLSLRKGRYLGHLDKSVQDEYIIAAMTSYNADGLYSEMHCHENPHISLVLSGGNLEKSKQ